MTRRVLALVVAAAVLAGCVKSMPPEEIAWVDHGEHTLGETAFKHRQWVLRPLDVQALSGEERGIEVQDRLVLAVTYQATNRSPQSRTFAYTSVWRPQQTALWTGTISDSGSTFYGPRTYCGNIASLPEPHAPSLYRIMRAEPRLGEGESLQFVACWLLGATSVPPYTLYLGDWEGETQITFDLGCIGLGEETVCPDDSESVQPQPGPVDADTVAYTDLSCSDGPRAPSRC